MFWHLAELILAVAALISAVWALLVYKKTKSEAHKRYGLGFLMVITGAVLFSVKRNIPLPEWSTGLAGIILIFSGAYQVQKSELLGKTDPSHKPILTMGSLLGLLIIALIVLGLFLAFIYFK